MALVLTPSVANQASLNYQAPASTVEPIRLNVTILAKNGTVVTGLKQANFEISIEKKPAKVVSFSDEDSPVSIGIVFDSSGSMRAGFFNSRKNLDTFREAIRRFLELSNESKEKKWRKVSVKVNSASDATKEMKRLTARTREGFY